MRALLCHSFGPVEDLRLEETADPVPGPGEILLEVRAAGVNFPDLLVVQGKYQVRPPLPFVPGGECAGVVVGVGDGLDGALLGERRIAVGLTGAFGEKMAVPAAKTVPMPEEMSFEVAAGTAITYGTSYYALKQQGRLAPGESLLVLGAAGGVGLAAVELGAHLGAKVIAAASTEAKLDTAEQSGAAERLNYSGLSPKALKEAIKELTGGRGADVVLDPVGGEVSEAALRSTAFDGRFLVVGFASGEIARVPLNLALLKGAHIIGVFWGSWMERQPGEAAENIAELMALLTSGKLRPKVTSYPLGQFTEAFASLAQRQAQGKLVLSMG